MPVISKHRRSGRTFITRSGRKLYCGSSEWRVGGCNVHWMAQIHTTSWAAGVNDYRYPSVYQLDDGFATAKALGCRLIRVQSAMPSVGAPTSVYPTVGALNETAMRAIDLMIAKAAEHDVWLMIPFCDPYGYFFGSTTTWSNFYGGNGSDFYSNATVINGFKSCLTTYLNRVNTYTGIRYADDPTVAIWETGNEIGANTAWKLNVGAHIKSLAPRQLLMDGNYGIAVDMTSWDTSGLFDIVSNHYYPMSASNYLRDNGIAAYLNRVFMNFEYDWNNVRGGDSLDTFLAAMYESRQGSPSQGWWNLAVHGDISGWDPSANNYNGAIGGGPYDVLMGNSSNQAKILKLRQFAYDFSETQAPPWPTPGIPRVSNASGAIAWRGVAGASCYTVERSSVSASAGFFRVASNLLDADAPWTDPSPPGSPRYYRVRAVNPDGVVGLPSNVLTL